MNVTSNLVTVDEVLLVDESPSDHNVNPQLLEGLTSNLFVVYPNKVIRTAGDGVLHGYARHVVTQAAIEKGWTVDTTTPIRLGEANQWQQVFLTSAIRLVVPVERVLVPDFGERGAPIGPTMVTREIWSQKDENDNCV